MIKELDYPAYNAGSFQRISWGAVSAGAIVSLALLVVLTALGAGLGMASTPSMSGFGVASAFWMLLSAAVSFYGGGWIAGRLTGIARISESVIHGIVAWAAATVLLAFVFTSATLGALGATASAVGSTLGREMLDVRVLGAVDAATAMQAAGVAGMFGFVLLACGAAAAAYGARAGTRVLRPIPMSEARREKVGV